MNGPSCETTRERLPDFVANRLDDDACPEVESHVAACASCGAELELLQALYASRPIPPVGLTNEIVGAIRADRAPRTRAWWGLSAAAVAALALGIGIGDRAPAGVTEVPAYAVEVEEGLLWTSDDGVVAGAPMLDALSDEALAALLDELSVGTAGGAA